VQNKKEVVRLVLAASFLFFYSPSSCASATEKLTLRTHGVF